MTSTDNTVAGTLHDVGLATWFGGSSDRVLGKELERAGDVPVGG